MPLVDKRASFCGCGGRIRTNDLRVIASRPLAVPEKRFGLTLILAFFDRCGKSGPPASATGSGGPLFPTSSARRPHNPNDRGHTFFSITAKNTAHRTVDCVFWWLRGKDSNQRPPGYEPDELPAALPRDIQFFKSLIIIAQRRCFVKGLSGFFFRFFSPLFPRLLPGPTGPAAVRGTESQRPARFSVRALALREEKREDKESRIRVCRELLCREAAPHGRRLAERGRRQFEGRASPKVTVTVMLSSAR